MYFFINYIRTIATILITNSHYAKIWPIDDLAAGGLLGNILFFAASGFCLFNVKENFLKWYVKRIVKIYPIMILFTLLTVLIGDFPLNSGEQAFRLFLYPTNYIFLVWLMIAYIAFYIVAWLSKKYKKFTEITLGVLLSAWLITYFIFIDKTVYHIDNVENPFILFLYFASMLIGALFRKYENKWNKVKPIYLILLPISLVLYFGSKIVFSKIEEIAFWQIFNQISILFVLYLIFAVCLSAEEKFGKFPKWLNKMVKFLSGITLPIYIVQFAVIRRFQNLVFPLNFIVVSFGIVGLAILVYYIEYFIRKGMVALLKKRRSGKNAESSD